tara:strand:- start:330 stop:530 length:201 start_codon:yes stop_codon:yes gene_type:complete
MRNSPLKGLLKTDPPSTKKGNIFRGKITTSSDGTKYNYDKKGYVKKMTSPDGNKVTKFKKGNRTFK